MCGNGSAKCGSLTGIIQNIESLSRLSSEMSSSQNRDELVADTVRRLQELIVPDESGATDPKTAQEVSVHIARVMQLLLETSFVCRGWSGEDIQNKISNDIAAIQQAISECQ